MLKKMNRQELIAAIEQTKKRKKIEKEINKRKAGIKRMTIVREIRHLIRIKMKTK